MRPPADPWGSPIEPVPEPVYPPPPTYGRAAVPVPPPALREPTAEMPVLPPTLIGPPNRTRRLEAARTRPAASRPVSWERTKNDTRRRLYDGWGFTAAGLIVAFCGWGIWAAAGRGSGASPLPALILLLAVAALVFAVSRLAGYVVWERMAGRVRLHARWTHLITGVFLAVAGVGYLLSTSWLIESGNWVRDGLNWINGHIPKH
jgi:hypothetical protein